MNILLYACFPTAIQWYFILISDPSIRLICSSRSANGHSMCNSSPTGYLTVSRKTETPSKTSRRWTSNRGCRRRESRVSLTQRSSSRRSRACRTRVDKPNAPLRLSRTGRISGLSRQVSDFRASWTVLVSSRHVHARVWFLSIVKRERYSYMTDALSARACSMHRAPREQRRRGRGSVNRHAFFYLRHRGLYDWKKRNNNWREVGRGGEGVLYKWWR